MRGNCCFCGQRGVPQVPYLKNEKISDDYCNPLILMTYYNSKTYRNFNYIISTMHVDIVVDIVTSRNLAT